MLPAGSLPSAAPAARPERALALRIAVWAGWPWPLAGAFMWGAILWLPLQVLA